MFKIRLFIQSINVGDEYQAQVEFNSVNEYSDDREGILQQFLIHFILCLVPVDELLWSANDIANEKIDEYLKTIRSECLLIIRFSLRMIYFFC